MNSLSNFRTVAKRSLSQSVEKYTREKELEINYKLLGKFLIENVDRFKRSVTQSEETLLYQSGMGHYYHVMPEIGWVAGKRLFFEIINENLDAVNIYVEKSRTETSPPTCVYLEKTNELCLQIVDFLLESSLEKKSCKNRETLVVPPSFYVFEFTCGPSGNQTKVVVPPFKAKDFTEALSTFYSWPALRFGPYPYPHSFRFSTNDGWQRLNSKRGKFAMTDARPNEYVLTLP